MLKRRLKRHLQGLTNNNKTLSTIRLQLAKLSLQNYMNSIQYSLGGSIMSLTNINFIRGRHELG